MKERYQIAVAKVVSLLCEPYYLPLLVYLVLLSFSYLKLLPMNYKLMLLGWLVLFTVVLPTGLLYLYKTLPSWPVKRTPKTTRFVAYIVFLVCYTMCLVMMMYSIMPQILQRVMFAALVIQVVCFVLTFFVRISVHSAAAGGLVGALVAFSAIFGFDPTGWLCVLLLFAGLVGTSRLVLRRHTLMEVNLGLAVGFAGSVWAILAW